MFGCNNEQAVKNPTPSQKADMDKQTKWFQGKVYGQETITAYACDSYWQTSLQCPATEPPFLWLQVHCDGEEAEGHIDMVEEGTCSASGGTDYLDSGHKSKKERISKARRLRGIWQKLARKRIQRNIGSELSIVN